MNNLTVIEYKDIRVLTTQQLADQYETDVKMISNNFNRNKERYQEGKHYIFLQGEELKEFKTNHQFDEQLKHAPAIYLWTEKGALLHAKSLNTDSAWKSYENLVDTYFKVKDIFDGLTEEMRVLLSHDKKIKIVWDHMKEHDAKLDNLENNMVIDYGQQQVLKEKVNLTVVKWLGGKGSNAYKGISKVVFSECNKDIQHYFNVNSRNNIPKIKFDDAVKYIENWESCYDTKLSIQNWNSQITMNEKAM